jgi:hypothetical protein
MPVREGILLLTEPLTEFTRTKTIQASKGIVLQHRATGDLFAGNQVRVMLSLPFGENARVRPTQLEEYRVFMYP